LLPTNQKRNRISPDREHAPQARSRLLYQGLSVFEPRAGGRSMSLRKDECHVMYPLLRKISNILVHLKNIHTHTLDRDRFSRPSREEGQLQAESDQDNRNNSDSVMHAHASPPGSRE